MAYELRFGYMHPFSLTDDAADVVAHVIGTSAHMTGGLINGVWCVNWQVRWDEWAAR